MIEAVAWAWKIKCSGRAKLILIALANACDPESHAYCSVTDLSVVSGYDHEEVRLALEELVEIGAVAPGLSRGPSADDNPRLSGRMGYRLEYETSWSRMAREASAARAAKRTATKPTPMPS